MTINTTSATHADFHFSVTIHTDDLAIVHCLRALVDFCQQGGAKKIAWGGTTEKNWKAAGHKITFRFTTPEFRANFLNEVARLLPRNLFNTTGQNDDDPATPQR